MLVGNLRPVLTGIKRALGELGRQALAACLDVSFQGNLGDYVAYLTAEGSDLAEWAWSSR